MHGHTVPVEYFQRRIAPDFIVMSENIVDKETKADGSSRRVENHRKKIYSCGVGETQEDINHQPVRDL